MNEAPGPAQTLGILLEQQRRQADAMEATALATRTLASDVRSLVSRQTRVALIYPWPNDPTIVRAVLVTSQEEERRLAEVLPRFDRDAKAQTLEVWLEEQGFRPVTAVQMSLGRGQGSPAGRSR